MFNNNFNFELVANTISGPNSINKVYEFLKEKNYQKELYEWLRFLKSHPDYNFDGLNADCLNLSSLLAKLGHVLYNPKIYEKFSSSFLGFLSLNLP